MNELTLESLGLDQDKLIDRLVDKIATNLMTSLHYDEDDNEWRGSSGFAQKLNGLIKARLDEIVNDMANKHVLPKVTEMVEGLVLQQTNQWGEKTGKPVTFIEYLTQRADAYMTEKVSYDGKSKNEAGGFSWSGTQTRISHLIEKHLHYSIENAMKDALKTVNSAVATGLAETAKLKLAEITAGLKVEIKTK